MMLILGYLNCLIQREFLSVIIQNQLSQEPLWPYSYVLREHCGPMLNLGIWFECNISITIRPAAILAFSVSFSTVPKMQQLK